MDTEAQRSYRTCPRSPRRMTLESGLFWCRTQCLRTTCYYLPELRQVLSTLSLLRTSRPGTWLFQHPQFVTCLHFCLLYLWIPRAWVNIQYVKVWMNGDVLKGRGYPPRLCQPFTGPIFFIHPWPPISTPQDDYISIRLLEQGKKDPTHIKLSTQIVFA